MEDKKNRTAYFYKHQRENYKRIISLIRKDDKELIDKINSVESVSNYVYSLMKKDVYGENHE